MAKIKNVVIAHCYGCEPSSHWFPWLENELKHDGLKVFVPNFGQDEVPMFDKWASALEAVLQKVDPSETVLIGHSLGGALIPRVLSGWKGEKFKAAFLVAAPFTDLGWPTLRPFFKKGVVGANVVEKVGVVKIFASDNDPYVPLEHAYKYQEILGGEVVIENGKEHLWQEEYEGLLHTVRQLFAGMKI
ncbi:hypothetical protein A2344_05240 [Candidatus Peregrinibacteria bacterium RIFOXYB12_FULL_41_12]|nr:MAG: hypothetical protein A2244_00555 [Candidatus Peregrinibacteria bacterium RIFOXYA2_FULL_41_18]OGJ48379.1 MAG: hypothetical protein A2344_05240 [Candidatus Peregrinibacteria bacterium RIFOXYB12_FULL_41_12]OGJ53160.1 MAG: hypothetical protein A2336_01735 [Candidatus Peregrinibacteria bacterium RIFOXYB2_FULL_41_88]OGJ53440.1 MAG: hypothetical protein A2448_04990 [Candidatus Peregrinibacteria bacterium RIFOXYC2_FULL_41_22]